MSLATIYVMLGDHEATLDILDRILLIPSQISARWLRLDPTFDPLRDDARFQAMLKKYEQGAG